MHGSFNTKLLALTIAAVGLLGLGALLYLWGPGGGERPPAEAARAVPGLALWDTGRPLAGAVFADASGAEVPLESLQGQVVLMNFWATWCVPCVTEMPALSRLQDRLGGPDFRVVAVNGDAGGREAAEPFLAEHGLENLTVLYDRGLDAGRELGVRALPTTILIGANGAELGRAEGPLEWDSPEMVELLAGIAASGVQPAAGAGAAATDFSPPRP